MFEPIDLKDKLARVRKTSRKEEDTVIDETQRILQQDLFAEKKILSHLRQYNSSFEVLDEEDLDPDLVFTPPEIKKVSVMYRLKFLESKIYKPEIPYEAILKIKELNQRYRKEVKLFRILAPPDVFYEKRSDLDSILFVKTNYDNYYLLHRWGRRLKWHRKIFYWPLRSFETLVTTVLLSTLAITLSLPTFLITLDPHATYWSGYRTGAFFHLFIFNMGVTAFITFSFTKNFSSSVWNRERDFG